MRTYKNLHVTPGCHIKPNRLVHANTTYFPQSKGLYKNYLGYVFFFFFAIFFGESRRAFLYCLCSCEVCIIFKKIKKKLKKKE